MKILYTAEATAGGGRDGHARSSDGNLDLRIVPPAELGGPGEPGTNPEQLLATGYAACFNNAVILVARRMKLDADDSEVTAKIGLGVGGGGGFDIEATLECKLPKVDREDAERLIAKAHEVCPFSRALHGNIPVNLVVVD
jgi:lipoyl-dependent peroxiredoxin